NNPILIRCKQCGSPTEFDVVTQNHNCQYCGATTTDKEGLKERNIWKREHHIKVSSQAEIAGDVFFSCGGCGAEVIVQSDKVIGKCEFCGGSLVRRSYAKSDNLPGIIVPFFITYDEAQVQVKKWLEKNKRRPEAKIIQENLDQLQGYYLPFQLVKGNVTASINRPNTFRTYSAASYLDAIAINTSSQLDNELLDAVEPFDFAATLPFDFHYLQDFNVKLQDLGQSSLRSRVSTEVANDFSETLKKKFSTDELNVQVRPQSLLVMSAALPFYIFKYQGVELVVNGQTGRVAVKKTRIRNTYKHIIEPSIIILAVFLTTLGLLHFFNGGANNLTENLQLTAGITFVLGLPTLIAYTQNRGAGIENSIMGSNPVETYRDSSGNLIVKENNQEKPRPEPVFHMELVSGPTPVTIQFYNRRRILDWIFRLLFLNFSPMFLGVIISGFNFSQVNLFNIFIWLPLSIPVTFVIFIQQGRVLIYDHPILYDYYTGKEIPKREYTWKRDFRFWHLFTGLGKSGLVIGLIVFLLILYTMSTLLISGIF
ncbi:MAG: hypothetical protein GX326_01310, partial [Clostridiaceae bacterium]|nr:hypothetical protein [Clostridiaceae bacterium]